MRRKGERPCVRSWPPYGPGHPVAGAISRGDRWFYAWVMQASTPYPKLSKLSGIPVERLERLHRGDPPSVDEIAALARAWLVTPQDVAASILDPAGT